MTSNPMPFGANSTSVSCHPLPCDRFMEVVRALGVNTAVPKPILAALGVDGMTRENVASHLQKYRLYLKRLAEVAPGDPIPEDKVEGVQVRGCLGPSGVHWCH